MTEERKQEIYESIRIAVQAVWIPLAGVTPEEIGELQDEAKMEESKFHSLAPIIDPTMYVRAGSDPYEAVHKRLGFAALVVDPVFIKGKPELYRTDMGRVRDILQGKERACSE